MIDISVSTDNKIYRILSLFERLNKGESLNKQQCASYYQVSEKSIQRDISDLNEYLFISSNATRNITYKRLKGYYLSSRNTFLTDKDIFSICKVLFESRAFCKEELDRIVDSLLNSCEEKKLLKEMLENEKYLYFAPHHGKAIVDFLWQIALSIRKKRIANIIYIRQDGQSRQRKIKPLGIIFNEYYFYLIAEICDISKNYPATFRVDRIQSYQITEKDFYIPYRDRFEEGEYRKRIHFMYQGELIHIQFKFWGDSLEAVLDRIPTAKIVGYKEDKAIIEAEVYSKGIVMWLFSQKEYLEVVKPESLRVEMKESIQKMLDIYQK
ncbi:MAG: helix-turn-helix transcriptional regulator [Faecalispora sporosphaeroides]|uniref:helix-turn-helix transcriptional regulator n=1 Tax=Faecalispora sporosphaeroides TaxID=1549 RepID=UPI0039941571